MGAWHRFNPPNGKKKLPPLRSVAELADEFGVNNAQTLGGIMAHSPVAPPEPECIHRGNGVTKRYYEPAKMRAWWAAHQAATKGKS